MAWIAGLGGAIGGAGALAVGGCMGAGCCMGAGGALAAGAFLGFGGALTLGGAFFAGALVVFCCLAPVWTTSESVYLGRSVTTPHRAPVVLAIIIII